MVNRWGEADDARLVALWRQPHNGVDPTQLDQHSVRAVFDRHFSNFKYKNFAPLYRGKARDFNVNQSLAGHRRRAAAAAAVRGGGVNIEDISDDESDPFEEEEEGQEDEEDNLSDFEEEDWEELQEDDEEVEEVQMPPRRTNRSSTARRTPPRPAAAAARPAAPPVAAVPDVAADLANNVERMNLRDVPMFNMDFKLPYLLSTYADGDDMMCKADINALMLPKEFYVPDIGPGGNVLTVKVQVPPYFTDEDRVLQARQGHVTANTSEVQAFKNTCNLVDTHFGFVDAIFGDNPMEIALPFACEERIVDWEIQAYPNNEGDLTDDLGGQQFHASLVVVMRKQRTRRRTNGGFRVVGDAGMNNGGN